MKNPSVLGIYRERAFSPGKVRDDAAVLDSVLSKLTRWAGRVQSVPAEALTARFDRPDCALSMAQSPKVLTLLQEWQNCGTRVINTASSVFNCYRTSLTAILSRHPLPVPPGRIVSVNEVERGLDPPYPLWLKRGDVHAMEPGDVRKVDSRMEMMDALLHFRRRGIADVLLQEHVEGETVKFYGAGPGLYFSAFRASNGERATEVGTALGKIAGRAAKALGLEVFGGDAVLTERGKMVLVDLNDWPSFSPCCAEAAESIARHAETSVLQLEARTGRISSTVG